ncbi:MAG TPA: response regulator transcription factor [Phycisphaerae bacterium]|nr:response regulator transcription factor [Phycisphaerae bacterium]
MSAKPKAQPPLRPSTARSLKRRIFVVDDHPIVRAGLVQLINNEADLEVCGQGEDAQNALRAIRDASPDLALLDVSLKDSDGLELAKDLKGHLPHLPILMLSMHDEALYTERALRAGARGFLMKEEAPQTLIAAIRKVLAGGVYVSEKMNANLLQGMARGKRAGAQLPMDRLTDRELEIFRLIGDGKTVKEIADALFLSVKTVESHREHIKDKLNIRTSAELLRFATQNALPGGRD